MDKQQLTSNAPKKLTRLALREQLDINRAHGDIKTFLSAATLTFSDRKEFVANDAYERKLRANDRVNFFEDILSKADFVRTFYDVLPKLGLRHGDVVLELGASHGWASVIVKAHHPECYVAASDLLADCLNHARHFESLLGTALDEKWSFNSRAMPFADGVIDCIFTFASFHHFFTSKGNYEDAVKEIVRVLKPGGKAVLLYEPCAPRFLYEIAYRRANQQREHDGADEDLLVAARLRDICKNLGAACDIEYFPYYKHRMPFPTVYYYLLAKLPLLRFLAPCTVNARITKRQS